MDAFRIIDKFVRPPHTNLFSYIDMYKEDLKNFTQFQYYVNTIDNMRISCIFYQNNNYNPHFPVVVYNHTHGCSKYEALTLLDSCKSLGLSLLTYDERGCG